MLARVNRLRAFYRFVVLTLDAPVPGKREDDERAQAGSTAAVTRRHAGRRRRARRRPAHRRRRHRPADVRRQPAADLTWEPTLAWLARHTDLPIVLKGIQTHEDARRAARYAADHPGTVAAIVLSNHGGRALDNRPARRAHPARDPQVCPPRSSTASRCGSTAACAAGTDIVKALCLGAKAVGIGRAALWGLGAGGPAGVERTFESVLLPLPPPPKVPLWQASTRARDADPRAAVLMSEMATCMRLLGATKISDLGAPTCKQPPPPAPLS